jgi:uncharacterized repeat protein (TIGR02543 family)
VGEKMKSILRGEIKSIIVCLLVAVLVFSNCSLITVKAVTDEKGPTISEYSVNGTEFKVGDKVIVSVKMSDESGISSSKYDSFITIDRLGDTDIDEKYCYLENKGEGLYQTTYEIPEIIIEGDYYVSYIITKDIYGNQTKITDISNMNFHISSGITDGKGPIISEYSVNGTEFIAGDEVIVTVKLEDESGISITTSDCVIAFTKLGTTIASKTIYLEKIGEGVYQAAYQIPDNLSYGDYSLYISAHDIYGNETYQFYDSTLYTVYSDKKYKEISPISNTNVYLESIVISSQTIDGDVYVGPNAIVTFRDVTINGNLYVLGAAELNTVNARNIYGSNMTFGYMFGTVSNGTICIKGQNTIESLTCSTQFMYDIPYHIDPDSIKIADGKMSFNGSTVNVCDLYVNGIKMNLENHGKFIAENIDLDGNDYAILEFKTVFGNTITKKVTAKGGAYTITFNPNSGTCGMTKTNVVYGEKYGVLPTASKINCRFDGWYTESEGGTKVEENDIFASYVNQTLYAHWKYIALNSITIKQNKTEIGVGRHLQCTVTYNPENTTAEKKVNWSSSNTDIAKVDSNGKITGVSEGTATITAKCGEIITTTSVKVINKPIMQGDVSGDDSINVLDIELQQKNILGIDMLEDADYTAADMNDDHKINVLDMEFVQKIVLGIK